MAQYYQVLRQGEKNTVEDLRQYYPNLIENQTVQYVINPEDQSQQFQGQQILVSSDQLMVIENTAQHVIVDPSVTYQNSQYVLQENSVEYQDPRQQQVFYMEEVESDRQVQVEPQVQQQPTQPIVLNHQLPQSQLRNQVAVSVNTPQKTTVPVQVRQPQIHQMPQQSPQVQAQSPVRQILQQARTTAAQLVQQRATIPQQARQPSTQAQISQTTQHVQQQTSVQQIPLPPKVPMRTAPGTSHGATSCTAPNQRVTEVPSLHFTQPQLKQSEITESDSHEAVALADGRIMILADYKQMLAEKRNSVAVSSPAVQQRMEVPTLVKYGTPTVPSAKPKPSRSINRGRTRRTPVRGATNSNSVPFPVHNNANAQRFNAQQQLKLASASSTKPCIPQNQYLHQAQQRQQLLQQQTSVRQQQPSQQQLQRQAVQQQHQPIQSHTQSQFIIQPPSQHQPHVQCPLPPYVASRQIQQIIENTPISEEYSDSIRMLVLLENGEQRLITFTLPKEVCTIQEILEQVGVPFHPDTKIECTETNHSGINYLVTVGTQHHENNEEAVNTEEAGAQLNSNQSDTSGIVEVASKAPTPEPIVEVEAPRYVPGLLAVCNHCGYTSENFNRCLRCRYKLPDEVKTIPVLKNSGSNGKKSDVLKVLPGAQDKKSAIPKGLGDRLAEAECADMKQLLQNGTSKVANGSPKKKKTKVVEQEPVVLTLSSDEEGEEPSDNKLSETDQIIRRLSNSAVTLSTIKKEPSASDIQQNISMEMENYTAVGGGKDDCGVLSDVSTSLFCRTIRIGSYRYIPNENLVINTKGIVLQVPTPKDPNDIKTIVIERKHMVKVLVNFQKALPVIFYYVMPSVGQHVREQLGMTEGSELYFDPLSKEEAYKRITVLPENVTEETKNVFKIIYGKPFSIMDELTTKEANDILVKTCPKELSKVMSSSGYTEIKQLLIYPPGKGGLSINTEDYICLAQDQFLNDVIIDFYLKYLVLNLPKDQQEKVHVFSTFFYKRLTTKPVKASRRSHPAEVDPSLTPAQKRHARVEKWSKNVNLFEKDFIIIPINENCHWFLAIVCFPGIEGCTTMDGKRITIAPKQKKKAATTIGNVTITAVKKEKDEKAILCDDGEGSDRDEAEADDSELDSEEDSEETEPELSEPLVEAPQIECVDRAKRPPIKQACILIFDSLAGASRSRVVATLRDYLTCEYKAKMGKEKIFNKDVIKGSCPKVPQQTNFTDCGLYLLQYVEQFFQDPIQDYYIPIKQVKNWFDEFIVTKKREDISFLIKELMVKYNKDPSSLPEIMFPTLNGQLLIIHHQEDEEDEFMDDFEEDEEEMLEDCDTSDCLNDTINSEPQFETEVQTDPTTSQIRITLNQCVAKEEKSQEVDIKPSLESVKQCESFVTQTVSDVFVLKPDVSETQKQRSRETLSYLKSKRINRHKNVDMLNIKKFKPSE